MLGGIRTPDLVDRNHTLYPTELRARLPRTNAYDEKAT